MSDSNQFEENVEEKVTSNFVHLHVHSDYSLLDSCATIDKLVAKAVELKMPALALTDHGNMFGALNFEKLCHKNGINPIVGEEFYVAYGSHYEKNDVPFAKHSDNDEADGKERHAHYFHLILLCENQKGYENLCWLSSRAFCDENALYYGKPRIDFDLLKEYHEGLICCTACIQGEIPQYLLNDHDDEAYEIARQYKELFGPDHFYIELQDHGLSDQKEVAKKLIKLANDLDIPMVVTNDVHYVEKEDAKAQDALRCIGFKNLLHKPHAKMGGDRDIDNWYMKSEEEMRLLFPELPQAYDNTVKIANMCNLTIKEYSTPELKDCLPRFELPQEFRTHGEDYQKDQDDYVRYIVETGLEKRYGVVTPEIKERAEYEMNTIFSMGFSGYFLIVWEFINWAKSTYDNVNNRPKPYIPIGPGRGSGAGSLVAYAMTITDIDPFKYGLIFERFLNPERVSMPDFDVDMDFDYRQDIIQHTRDLYGDANVGHIVTFGTLKPKNCIADVGRILDIPLSEVNMLKKCIPDSPKATLKSAFDPPSEKFPDGGQLAQYKDDSRYQELFDLAFRLEGVKRNTGLHASGMVIGLTELPNWAPIFKDAKTGEVAVQYTMDIIEPCGLVKFDYLGLKTLSLIRYAEEIVNKHKKDGEELLDCSKVSEEDEKTFDLFCRGDSIAIFQFESPGMQKILRQCQPRCIEELVALNALYRPGPMDYIPKFIEGKWNPASVEYPDPSLEDLLKETYGVMVYQEQVMKVAQIISGFSLGGADMLRRAMGKKKLEVLMKKKEEFIAGAVKNGHTESHADEIFEIMVPFAGYGFNKSHAAAYSVLAYRTGWLKAHYPAEFMAANLTNEITSTDGLPAYIAEARNIGVPVDPPDINRSDVVFDVIDGRIVFGLKGIKGMGEAAAQLIIHEREENGPYKNFMDFLKRAGSKMDKDGKVQINKKAIEVLIKTGAFDNCEKESGSNLNRATLLENMEAAINYAVKSQEDARNGQASLFDDFSQEELSYNEFEFKIVNNVPPLTILNMERECIGCYVSGHPLDIYKKIIDKSVNLKSSNFQRVAAENKTERETRLVNNGGKFYRNRIQGKSYIALGMLAELKTIRTKKGDEMAFAKLTDHDGDINCTFFPSDWGKLRNLIEVGGIYAFSGQVNGEREIPSFEIHAIEDINLLEQKATSSVHIEIDPYFNTKEALVDLKNFIFAKTGNCSVYFHIQAEKNFYVIKANEQLTMTASDEDLESLRKITFVKNVWTE